MAQEPEVKPGEEKEKLYPQSEFRYVVKQRDEVKQTLHQQEAELTELRAFKATQDEAQRQLEADKAAATGKAAEAIKAAQEAAKRTVEAERQQTYSNLKNELVPQAAKAAVAGVQGILPSALEDAATLISSRLEVDPKTFKIYVKDENGQPMTRKDGTGLVSPQEYASTVLANKPHFIASKLVNNTGGKVETQINGQNKTWDQLSRDELAKLQQENPQLEKEMYEAYESERRTKQQKKRDKALRKELERSNLQIPG